LSLAFQNCGDMPTDCKQLHQRCQSMAQRGSGLIWSQGTLLIAENYWACVRARLQSCHKCSKMNLGFSA
jgi:hypothetical protein